MLIKVNPFTIDSEEMTFRKIYEELCELSEVRKDLIFKGPKAEDTLKMEIGDLLTAIVNWCEWIGLDPQECVELAEAKNRMRGRYL